MSRKMHIHQLLILVLFSNLIIALNSSPSSIVESDSLLPANVQLQHVSSFNKPLLVRKWRKELAELLNDYPGTGPNPGHTPGPPPPARGK